MSIPQAFWFVLAISIRFRPCEIDIRSKTPSHACSTYSCIIWSKFLGHRVDGNPDEIKDRRSKINSMVRSSEVARFLELIADGRLEKHQTKGARQRLLNRRNRTLSNLKISMLCKIQSCGNARVLEDVGENLSIAGSSGKRKHCRHI